VYNAEEKKLPWDNLLLEKVLPGGRKTKMGLFINGKNTTQMRNHSHGIIY
jgi:hypothetical protein